MLELILSNAWTWFATLVLILTTGISVGVAVSNFRLFTITHYHIDNSPSCGILNNDGQKKS